MAGLPTFENKVVVGGKTYNVNFGNNLNTISSGPGSSPGVTLSLVSRQTTFATTSTSLSSDTIFQGLFQVNQSLPTGTTPQPPHILSSYLNIGAAPAKTLSTASGDLSDVSNPNTNAYSLGLLRGQGYSLGQAKELLLIQEVTNAASSVKIRGMEETMEGRTAEAV